jgi:hypothetical protein
MLMNTIAIAVTFAVLPTIAAPDQNQSPSQMREVNHSAPNPSNAKDAATETKTGQPPPISANQPAQNDNASTDSSAPSSSSIRSSLLDEGPEPRRRTSAADVLKQLQQKQRDVPIIAPQTTGVDRQSGPRTTISDTAIPSNAVQPVDRKLMPDGSRIVDRPGRLTRDGDYLTFTFESRGEGPIEVPLRLLPNRLLEDMEVIAEGGRNSIVFVVSGEVTEYRGVNYLMLQKLLMRPDLGNFQ